jgi:hypothetical protein
MVRAPILYVTTEARRASSSLAAMVNRASADILARFGFAVKERQEALGLTQGQFAERAGIHRTNLSDIGRACAT